jgi:ABC-2 type transport system permease protein
MSTTVAEPPVLRAARKPSIARLTEVELRKMADTRAGLTLLIVIGVLNAAMVTLILVFGDPPDFTLESLYTATLLPSGLLLPVLGILLVTTEWTQRTALTTFTLVPERERVAAAKLIAGVLIGAASVVVSLAFGALGHGIAVAFLDAGGGWSLGWNLVGTTALGQVLNVVMGVAFGMLLVNTALAIVLFFAVPIVWGILGETIRALSTVDRWLNIGQTTTPLYETGMTGAEWGRLGTSVALWVLVPLGLGLVRLLRREVA